MATLRSATVSDGLIAANWRHSTDWTPPGSVDHDADPPRRPWSGTVAEALVSANWSNRPVEPRPRGGRGRSLSVDALVSAIPW
jgi:hypothetical protein